MSDSEKYGSGEYNPTPSHYLPAFISGEPRGYMCIVCNHLQKDLDPVWDDICPVCLLSWAKKHVPKMIPTKEAIKLKYPLEKTVILKKEEPKDFHSATTKIISLNGTTETKKENNDLYIVTKSSVDINHDIIKTQRELHQMDFDKNIDNPFAD